VVYLSRVVIFLELVVHNSFGLFQDDSVFLGTSAVGETSSLTTKENFCFIFFDSIRNPPRLHMNMNLGFSSSVDFGIGEIGFIIKLLSSRDFALLTVA